MKEAGNSWRGIVLRLTMNIVVWGGWGGGAEYTHTYTGYTLTNGFKYKLSTTH